MLEESFAIWSVAPVLIAVRIWMFRLRICSFQARGIYTMLLQGGVHRSLLRGTQIEGLGEPGFRIRSAGATTPAECTALAEDRVQWLRS